MVLALPSLRWRRAEHDQFPFVADFVEQEDVHAIVIRSDFDVAIAGSVPLIQDFYDVDPTLASIKTSGCRFEIRMRLDLNAHEIHGITRSRRSNFRTCPSLHATTKSLRIAIMPTRRSAMSNIARLPDLPQKDVTS
jgi:hypothetical protein